MKIDKKIDKEKLLSLEEIDKVVGGTRSECRDLYWGLIANEAFGLPADQDWIKVDFTKLLKEKLGIYVAGYEDFHNKTKHNSYLGPADPNAPRGTPGALPTKVLTHEEVLQRIAAYKG